MALNAKTFQTRTLTAIIFVVIMAVGLLWSRWSFFLLFSVIHFGCWFGYQRLVVKFSPGFGFANGFQRLAAPVAGWLLMYYASHDELITGSAPLGRWALLAALVLVVLFPLVQWLTNRTQYLRNISFSLFGILYISFPLALMIHLRNHWQEEEYRLNQAVPILIILTIWVNDTMAYIVGSLIGRTPLSSISPKKTLEGTIGGIILAVVVICFVAAATARIAVKDAAIMSLLAAIAGTFGDLFQSKLKRLAGVKDSGQIMPGHGGFLDRFDSLLFATVVVWIYATIVL